MNLLLNYILWNPDVELFSLFGFSIRYYSLLWAVGLGLAYYIVHWLYRDQHLSEALFEPLFFYCFIGILIGARLGHCLFYDWAYYHNHLVEMLLPVQFTPDGMRFTGYQGLASHGGTIGLIAALWLYVRRTRLNFVHVLDNVAVATPATACCIRLGNLMNSEIVGKVTDVPWAFIFPREGMEPRHPAQLYEALAYAVIFVIGFYLYKRWKDRLHRGFFFGWCLASIFTFRFFIEFVKAPQEAFEADMVLNMGQLLSIPFAVLGIACMIGGPWLCRLSGETSPSQRRP